VEVAADGNNWRDLDGCIVVPWLIWVFLSYEEDDLCDGQDQQRTQRVRTLEQPARQDRKTNQKQIVKPTYKTRTIVIEPLVCSDARRCR
jgi:hypothetical protein